MKSDIRNIAIIAHIDHGKTTLIDKMLAQSESLNSKLEERFMDSGELEKERGITISSKNVSISWEGYKINVIDTPGHADFGGEVERVLSMVDSVLLLVDSVDGPMPQTRFVTKKAFQWGLKPIVVINKIDREGARPNYVIDQIFDLFVSLGADDDQLDFPIVYTSALRGFSTLNIDSDFKASNMDSLFDTIVNQCPSPKIDNSSPFQMQVASLSYSPYVGAIAIGKVNKGSVKSNSEISVIDIHGNKRKEKISKLFHFSGVEKIETDLVSSGEIVAIAGIDNPRISETICSLESEEAMKPLSVDEPTISMVFSVNTSPFSGREGKFSTSRQIRERLDLETITNVALQVEIPQEDTFVVSGRGELHIGILIETMRREGYEFSVSRPEVVNKVIDGIKCEPYEQLVVDIPNSYQGKVVETISLRGGALKNIDMGESDRTILEYIIPTRGMIGLHSKFLSLTSGNGIMHHVFCHYGAIKKSDIVSRNRGVLISNCSGTATAFSIWNLQKRGEIFIKPQEKVYEGMIIGLNSRPGDLVVNITKDKQLTNIRASSADTKLILVPTRKFSLEESITFIKDDELVEITPQNIRFRKKVLSPSGRKNKNN